MFRTQLLSVCMISSLGLATMAGATTLSATVTISNGGGGVAGCGMSPNQGASRDQGTTIQLSDGGISCATFAEATATGGVVGIEGTLSSTPGTGNVRRVSASAISRMFGIYLTPSLNFTAEEFQRYLDENGPIVTIGANAQSSGTVSADISLGSPFTRSAGAQLEGFASISGTGGTARAEANASFATTNTGDSSGDNQFNNALTPTVQHDYRQPFSVSFSLSGRATVANYTDATGFANFDSSNSLGFSTTGPAFIIPEFFTVNAPEIGIINNRWTDPRVPIGPAPIPLPAGLPLLLAGLGGLMWVRHHG